MPETVAAALPIISAVSAVGSVVSTVKGFSSSSKAGQAGKAAAAAQQQQNDIKQARERRAAVRDARIRVSAADQSAANQGVSTSSSIAGGMGGVLTQGYDAANFLDQTGALTNQINNYRQQSYNYAADSSFNSSISDSFSKLPQAATKFGNAFSGIKSIFD